MIKLSFDCNQLENIVGKWSPAFSLFPTLFSKALRLVNTTCMVSECRRKIK